MSIAIFQNLTRYDLDQVYRIRRGEIPAPNLYNPNPGAEQGVLVIALTPLQDDLEQWQQQLPGVGLVAVGITTLDQLAILFLKAGIERVNAGGEPLWTLPIEQLPSGTYSVINSFFTLVEQLTCSVDCTHYLQTFFIRSVLEKRERLLKFIESPLAEREQDLMQLVGLMQQTERYQQLLHPTAT